MMDLGDPTVVMVLNEFDRTMPHPRIWRVVAVERDRTGQWFMELVWYERRVKICFEVDRLYLLRARLLALA